jgi:hypothetical protein
MRIIVSGLLIMQLASCGSQKINIGAVKSFAGSTKDISANTTAVYENMWQLKYDIVQLSIATIDSCLLCSDRLIWTAPFGYLTTVSNGQPKYFNASLIQLI